MSRQDKRELTKEGKRFSTQATRKMISDKLPYPSIQCFDEYKNFDKRLDQEIFSKDHLMNVIHKDSMQS